MNFVILGTILLEIYGSEGQKWNFSYFYSLWELELYAVVLNTLSGVLKIHKKTSGGILKIQNRHL